ncbi:uncharacterized protein LOC117337079 [Pecten maximus]|uniref:uncharacterized protein LOC117337079 n=1 Tax=Pecten maximus TaxID=6579 RepID=UPI0014588662|nr:uncharacterized protein LOC117337079 [Pecten maximus]XP_033753757.1 uncharacterized protein LOC117337079 [Pecten maximus]
MDVQWMMGHALLFGKGNALRNKDKCTLTTCTKHRNKKGERTTTRLKEKYYGCPIDGVCKDKDVTRSADCTAYKCELSKGHTLMTWAVIQTGCQTDDGCEYNGDEWPDLDETSCVTRRCDVTYDKVKDMYTKSNNVARHGCRASNGTCYYDGETWPENDCYTWRCDISMTDEGRSMASSNIESGICQDADGSCKDYGETMRYWSGKTMLDCRCEKAISIKGFPYGNPICAIP